MNIKDIVFPTYGKDLLMKKDERDSKPKHKYLGQLRIRVFDQWISEPTTPSCVPIIHLHSTGSF